jgi:PIN domain nuclease of toxin-antitoxin system
VKVLLDTHVFLWWVTNKSHLSEYAHDLIADGHNELLLSAAAGWEIVIKANLGKLRLPDNPVDFIMAQMALNRIEPLSISMRHALHVHTLPSHHRDPFDRIMIAQCQVERAPILTADPLIARYAVERLW